MLYWAYGSNLCIRHFLGRCPSARPLRSLHVQDSELVFRGVADVTLNRGRVTPGGIWRIRDERDVDALDKYEGVSTRLYLKRYLQVKNERGVVEDCLFYQMKASRGIMPPSEVYIDTIAEGYRDFDLDTAYLDEALSNSWGRKNVTPFLRERHIKRGRPRLARA